MPRSWYTEVAWRRVLVPVVVAQVSLVVGSPEVKVGRQWRPGEPKSWSLGGPDAKVATCEAKEAPKRRTRRTHCEQPVGSLGALVLSLPIGRIGYACVL